MRTHFLIIHGISAHRNRGWSESLRKRCVVPSERWHEFNWNWMTDVNLQHNGSIMRWWQRRLWRLAGNAIQLHANLGPHIAARLLRFVNVKIPSDAPICVVCHSAGNWVYGDYFPKAFDYRSRLSRVIHLGNPGALTGTALWPENDACFNGDVWNIRALTDPVSLGMREPFVKEKWIVSAWPPTPIRSHVKMWNHRLVRDLIMEVA